MDIVISTNPMISADTLSAFERQHKMAFPPDYKQFLLETNGGVPLRKIFDFVDENGQEADSFVRYFLSLHAVNDLLGISENLKELKDRIPKGYLPIAEDSFGNMVLISARRADYGSVYFWDHELEDEDDLRANISLVAKNFTDFVNGLQELP